MGLAGGGNTAATLPSASSTRRWVALQGRHSPCTVSRAHSKRASRTVKILGTSVKVTKRAALAAHASPCLWGAFKNRHLVPRLQQSARASNTRHSRANNRNVAGRGGVQRGGRDVGHAKPFVVSAAHGPIADTLHAQRGYGRQNRLLMREGAACPVVPKVMQSSCHASAAGVSKTLGVRVPTSMGKLTRSSLEDGLRTDQQTGNPQVTRSVARVYAKNSPGDSPHPR